MTTPDPKPEPDAGEWIEWDGNGVPPIPRHSRFLTRFRDGPESRVPKTATARTLQPWLWAHTGDALDYIAYRIVSDPSLRRADVGEP